MHSISRVLVVLALTFSPLFCFAQAKKIGDVTVNVDGSTIPVRVSASTPDLQKLAQQAFSSHGRYRVVPSGHAFDIKFTGAGNQVRVDVTRGSAATVVVSQVVSGNSPRHALLKAADVAVEKTNGLGLRGFFTGRLAFVVQPRSTGPGEIYVSDLFWGEAKQVTRDNALVMTPRWSPDGSRVLYTSFFKTGAPDIYMHDPASGRRDIVANFRGMNMGASFSGNGQRIAMVLSGSGASEIFVRPTQGGSPTRLTRMDSAKSSPSWSPDGSQIVFAMEPGPQLYLVSSSGGSPRRLSAAGAGTYMAEPDWCRTNPNKIACTVRKDGRFQIAVIDVASGTAKVVSKAGFDAVEPSWLADGRHLVYTARAPSTSVLSILDTETGSSRAISGSDRNALQASVWMAQ